jgi:hypothetical protein
MPKPAAFPVLKISQAEAQRRFKKVATIRDRVAFTKQLNALIREAMADQQSVVSKLIETKSQLRALIQEAERLRSDAGWVSLSTDIQRGREETLREFLEPHNLPLVKFAKLAHKSRQQIYKDVHAKRLLALDIVGRRGQRIPDWQLDAAQLQLTQAALTKAPDVAPWTLFHALSRPCGALEGQSPVAAVRRAKVDRIVGVVLNILGVQEGTSS